MALFTRVSHAPLAEGQKQTVLVGFEIHSGEGTPESKVVAQPGALYLDSEGGANATLYVKESGTSNTGWVAK